MIKRQGIARLHRYYRIQGGTHIDGRYSEYGDRVRPLLPCARRSFVRLTRWVERDRRPPASTTVSRADDRVDQVNLCGFA